jgi:hypothetical protein
MWNTACSPALFAILLLIGYPFSVVMYAFGVMLERMAVTSV